MNYHALGPEGPAPSRKPPIGFAVAMSDWITWLSWQVLQGWVPVPKALQSLVYLCWKHEAHPPQHTASPAGSPQPSPMVHLLCLPMGLAFPQPTSREKMRVLEPSEGPGH